MVKALQQIRTGGKRLAPLIETVPDLADSPWERGSPLITVRSNWPCCVVYSQRHFTIFRQRVIDRRTRRLRRCAAGLLCEEQCAIR